MICQLKFLIQYLVKRIIMPTGRAIKWTNEAKITIDKQQLLLLLLLLSFRIVTMWFVIFCHHFDLLNEQRKYEKSNPNAIPHKTKIMYSVFFYRFSFIEIVMLDIPISIFNCKATPRVVLCKRCLR